MTNCKSGRVFSLPEELAIAGIIILMILFFVFQSRDPEKFRKAEELRNNIRVRDEGDGYFSIINTADIDGSDFNLWAKEAVATFRETHRHREFSFLNIIIITKPVDSGGGQSEEGIAESK